MLTKNKLSSNYSTENPYEMSADRQTNKKPQTKKLTICNS